MRLETMQDYTPTPADMREAATARLIADMQEAAADIRAGKVCADDCDEIAAAAWALIETLATEARHERAA